MFPVSALRGPTGAERRSGGASRALRRFLQSGEADGIGTRVPRRGWRLLSRRRKFVLFGNTKHGPSQNGRPAIWQAGVERRAGRWQVDGWGDCFPTRVEAEFEVTWWEPGWVFVTSKTRKVTVEALTGGCGETPEHAASRFDHAAVDRQDGRLLITLFFREAARTARDEVCTAEGLRIPIEVDLHGELGQRGIFDGSTVPPTEMDQPVV